MTPHDESVGHDTLVLDIIRQYNLFAVGTKFKPKR